MAILPYRMPPKLSFPRLGRHAIIAQVTLLALGTFFLTRVLLLAYSWKETAASPVDLLRIFGVGLVYDLAFCAFAAAPVAVLIALLPEGLWRSKPVRGLCRFALVGVIAFVGFQICAEVLFWDELNVRFNFIAVDYLIYTHEVIDNIIESYPMGLILGGLGLLSALVFWLVRKPVTAALDAPDTVGARWARAAAVVIAACCAFFFLDQSFRRISANPYQTELASNGQYQFIAAFRNNELIYGDFYQTIPLEKVDAEIREAISEPNATPLSTELLHLERRIVNPPRDKPLNVILVMVESLSADYLQRYGGKDGLTPMIDELLGQSLNFDALYATGTRTTRGLEAVTLSLPPTPGRSVVKRLGRETGMQSLGHILNGAGYESKFVYGGRGYFDNMNAFFQGNGYEIIDQTTVDKASIQFENAWGMSDDDLFRVAADTADRSAADGKPFFLHVMTTSNHRPFTYPDGRIDLPSGEGRHGAVKYTDRAIGDFLESARTHSWFDDTIFVVIADHCASSAGKVDLPEFRYHIPCFFYCPAHLEPRYVSTICSQIDVAPTLLSLLGISYTSTFFGFDVLAAPPESGRALIGTYQKLGLLQDDVLTILSPRMGLEQRVETRGAKIEVDIELPSERLRERCIAYFQCGAHVFSKHLNAEIAPGPRVAAMED
ncbi:Lipoteichoic acid synthase 2 [Planctomycetes bacterium Poly30]|uniref:Lipoteichoic acid synthase 2 n=1 Tax=Saltatorellus ferox TaxID=2528018 RepID=A0A518ENI0_9BACT|nr:Lipoteichoic acid synthase 2 [Planctomycetes bacterium Poly30]